MNNLLSATHEKQKVIFKQKLLDWNRQRAIPIFSKSKENHFVDIFYNIVSKYQHDFLTEEEKKNILYQELSNEHKECFLSNKDTLKNISKEICDVYQESLDYYIQINTKKKINRSAEIRYLEKKISGLEDLVITLQDRIHNGGNHE